MSVTAPPGQFFALSLADLGLPTSVPEFMALYVAAMQTAYPGYDPTANPADRAYIQAQIFASWAAEIAQLCSAGSVELLVQFGQQLLNLPYEQGSPALAVVSVTATDTAGHTLPQYAQFTLTLSGVDVAFQTTADLVIPNGSSTGTVTVAAVQSGTAFNTAAAPVELVSQINWVSTVALVTAASGGVDQEDYDTYAGRVRDTLTDLGYATATAAAFATRALNFVPAAGTDQEQVGRATAIDGYSPANTSFTVTATNTSPNLAVTSAPSGITAAPGASITGTDIATGAIVESSTSSSIVMSAPASGSGTGITATVAGTLGNERTVTVCVTDTSGNALNSDTMTAIAAYLQGFREEGFIVNVVAPTYATIYVTCSVVPQPGYSTATVQANVQAALLAYLSAVNFALPQGAVQGWQNSQAIYASAVNAVVQNTLGVLAVESLHFGLSSSPTNTADLILPGAFPLPESTSVSIPLSAITVI